MQLTVLRCNSVSDQHAAKHELTNYYYPTHHWQKV